LGGAVRKLLILLSLIPVACSNTKKEEEPLLTPEQRAELKDFVDQKVAALPNEVQLSEKQRKDAAPFAQAAAREIFQAARKYHANPTPERLKRFSRQMKKIRDKLRQDIQPLMTSSQANNYLAVFDKVIQGVRNLDLHD
jgi:glutaredoxin 2